MSENELTVEVRCGKCGGDIYFITCTRCNHDWAVASQCLSCGELNAIPCPECDTPKEDDDE